MAKKKFDKKKLSDFIIDNYHDDIVMTEDGYVDFENTVFNISQHIYEKMPKEKQKEIFEEAYEDVEELYDYIINYAIDLNEKLIEYEEETAKC